MKKFFFLPVLLLAAACSNKETPFSDEDSGVQTATRVVMYEAAFGLHNWVLEADGASFSETDEEISLTNPQIIFKKDDKEVSRIRGDKGSFSVQKNLIVLEGNVDGKDIKENVSIKTDLLNYDMTAKKIWTDRKFTLTRNGVTVRGQGLRANGDLTEIEITKQTTTLPRTVKEI